ncbi:hypothetical protein ACROYT_G025632 [Oculina patagonica]
MFENDETYLKIWEVCSQRIKAKMVTIHQRQDSPQKLKCVRHLLRIVMAARHTEAIQLVAGARCHRGHQRRVIPSVEVVSTTQHQRKSTGCKSTSVNVSSNGGYPTGSWASASSRSSVSTTNVESVSTKTYPTGGDKAKRYVADRVPNSASYKRYDNLDVKSASVKSYATAARVESATYRDKPVPSKRHANNKRRSASTTRNRYPDDESTSRRVATYGARGGGRVIISVPLNPWQVLGLHSSGVSQRSC